MSQFISHFCGDPNHKRARIGDFVVSGGPGLLDPRALPGPYTLRRMIGNRDFRRLWIGETISQVGSQLSLVALPVLAVETLQANAGQMGVLTACETLAFHIVGL